MITWCLYFSKILFLFESSALRSGMPHCCDMVWRLEACVKIRRQTIWGHGIYRGLREQLVQILRKKAGICDDGSLKCQVESGICLMVIRWFKRTSQREAEDCVVYDFNSGGEQLSVLTDACPTITLASQQTKKKLRTVQSKPVPILRTHNDGGHWQITSVIPWKTPARMHSPSLRRELTCQPCCPVMLKAD